MKAIIATAFLASTSLVGAVDAFLSTDSEQVPLQILRSENPSFPNGMRELGIREGEARVVISVDADGALRDTLVTGYTRREFAESAVASLKRWRFEPARVRGEPVASMREILFQFSNEGISVVSQTASEHMSAQVERMLPSGERYRVYKLSELDRPPERVHSPSPMYPSQLIGKRAGGRVTVEYYIDEEGRVRLPAIVTSTDQHFSSSVVDALQHWRFEAPLRGGKPVLVMVRQTFNFEPAETAEAGAAAAAGQQNVER